MAVTVAPQLKIKPFWYWFAVVLFVFEVILSITWTLFLSPHPWYSLRSGAPIALISLALLALSIEILDGALVTGVQVLGIPSVIFRNGGLAIIIPGIMKKRFEKKAIRQVQFPGPPEDTYSGPPEEFEAAAEAAKLRGRELVRPIYIMTGGPEKTTTDDFDPLTRRLQPIVSGTVSFTTFDPLSFQITAGGEAEAVKRLRDTWETTTATEFGMRTPAKIVTELKEVKEAVRQAIQELVANWGINVTEVNIQAPDFGKTVAAATAAQGAAIANADATKTTATADRFKVEQAGAGEASAIRAKGVAEGAASQARELGTLTGRTEGLKAMKESLGIDGDAVLAAETARAIQEKTDLVVATDGVAGILGTALKTMGALKKP